MVQLIAYVTVSFMTFTAPIQIAVSVESKQFEDKASCVRAIGTLYKQLAIEVQEMSALHRMPAQADFKIGCREVLIGVRI